MFRFHSQLDDSRLAARVRAGDESAFEVLVQRYQGLLHRFAQTQVGSEQALDIVQFVWLQFYRSLPALRSDPNLIVRDLPLKNWLLRVARNRCMDEIRWRKRHPWLFFSQMEGVEDEDGVPVLYALLDTTPIPEECALRKDGQECLHKAMLLLPILPRTVVWLRYAEALSFTEIAQRLHIPPATAKAYFQRARPKLRTALEGLSYHESERNRPMKPCENIC